MTLGRARSGESALHRLSAGQKLLGLVAVAVFVSAVHHPLVLATCLFGMLVVWSACRLGLPRLGALIGPLWWFLVPIAIFQVWVSGLTLALGTICGILVLVIAAAIVSSTTRPTDMLAAVEKLLQPLRPLGVDPQRASFAVTFVVRLVPFVGDTLKESRDAIRARGGTRNPMAGLAPASVRMLRHADALGEALDARGFGRGGAPT